MNSVARLHEEGLVPKFFLEYWRTTHGGDPIASERSERRVGRLAVTFFIVGLVLIFSGAVLMWWQGFHDWKAFPVIGLGTGLTVTSFWMISRIGKEWCHAEYLCSLEELFREFGVTPSVELGRISREEFSKYIGEILLDYGRLVDEQHGFAKVASRDRFRERHARALAWGLCEKEWTKYFPKKDKEKDGAVTAA